MQITKTLNILTMKENIKTVVLFVVYSMNASYRENIVLQKFYPSWFWQAFSFSPLKQQDLSQTVTHAPVISYSADTNYGHLFCS